MSWEPRQVIQEDEETEANSSEKEKLTESIQGSAKLSKNKIQKQTVKAGVVSDPSSSNEKLPCAKKDLEALADTQSTCDTKAAELKERVYMRGREQEVPSAVRELQDKLDIAMAEARELRESLKCESEQAKTRTNCLEADLKNRTQELQQKDLQLEQAKAQLQLLKQESDASEKRLREELQEQVEWWWQTAQMLSMELFEVKTKGQEAERIFSEFATLKKEIATLKAKAFALNHQAAEFVPGQKIHGLRQEASPAMYGSGVVRMAPEEEVKDDSPRVPCRILLPDVPAARVIGNRFHLKAICDKSGANLRVLPAEELPHDMQCRKDRVAVITGEAHQVQKAIAAVVEMEKLFDGSDLPTAEGSLRDRYLIVEVLVPDKSTSHLIGQQGERIKTLCQETQCDIKMCQDRALWAAHQYTARITAPSATHAAGAISRLMEGLRDLVAGGKLQSKHFELVEKRLP